MFETIVVGVDGREGGRDALALGASLAQPFRSRLVAVYGYPYDYYTHRTSTDELEAVRQRGALEKLEAELDAVGVDAHPRAIAASSPARALHVAAEHDNADLIVVGSSHHGAVGRVFAGDDATATLHGAPCPVLVASRHGAGKPAAIATIGIGFDGSPESEAALSLARTIAAATGARLELLVVVAPPVGVGPWTQVLADATDSDEAMKADAEAMLADALRDAGDEATGEVVAGVAADELEAMSRRVDLLVVGSRNFGPLRRLLLGSTSNRLVREAGCPVLVLPRGAQEREDHNVNAKAEAIGT